MTSKSIYENAVLCDIDGTVADCSHRLHWIKNKPKNWMAFYAGIPNDQPIQPTIDVVWLIMKKNFYQPRVVFCSGRPAEYHDVTRQWFEKYMPWANKCPLYMRPTKDSRQDYIVKEELLAKIREDGYNPVLAFDDRQQVVDMWRRNGLTCFQVAEGNF